MSRLKSILFGDRHVRPNRAKRNGTTHDNNVDDEGQQNFMMAASKKAPDAHAETGSGAIVSTQFTVPRCGGSYISSAPNSAAVRKRGIGYTDPLGGLMGKVYPNLTPRLVARINRHPRAAASISIVVGVSYGGARRTVTICPSGPRLRLGVYFPTTVPAPVLSPAGRHLTSTKRPDGVHRITPEEVNAAIAGSPGAVLRLRQASLRGMEPLEERRLMAGDASVVQAAAVHPRVRRPPPRHDPRQGRRGHRLHLGPAQQARATNTSPA